MSVTIVNVKWTEIYNLYKDNKNNPVAEIRFEDIYPTTIGALSFDQEAADTQYIKTTADFSYKLYTIVKL